MANLPVDFKDDIMNAAMSNKRRYRMINNSDGTVSFEDVTQYDQVGSDFGAAQVNQTNKEVNARLYATDVVDPMLATKAGFAADALKTKEQISELNKKTLQYKLVGNVQFDTSKWKGTVSCVTLSGGYIGFVFGTMTKQTDEPVAFGEIVGSIPGYYSKYVIPIPMYQSNGVIHNALVLMPEGNLRLYYPDFEKINASKSMYQFNTTFYMAK